MVQFNYITPGSNEATDLQDVLKSLIDQGKEELTTLDMPHEDSQLIRGQILGWRQLLRLLVEPKDDESLGLDPTQPRPQDGVGY